MQALELIQNSSYDPATIELLGQAFDEIWLATKDQYSPNTTAAARLRLAHTLLSIGRDHNDLDSLKKATLEAIAKHPL